MKVRVECWEKKFVRLVPLIRKAALKIGRFSRINGLVEVFLVGNGFMRKNVLSFPAAKSFPRPDLKEKPLGEIYLNPAYIAENGEDLIFMLVHGLLHLLGYDHQKKSDTISMEKKEKQLMKLLNS